MTNNFQREGSISNAHVREDFERRIMKNFNANKSLKLNPKYKLKIGINKKKEHEFDLGYDGDGNKIVVECKSHTWTSSDKVPSAKLTVWNEAMYYFTLVPNDYRKIFCVLKSYSQKRKMTLAQYYVERYFHLIPENVEIFEYDYEEDRLERLI